MSKVLNSSFQFYLFSFMILKSASALNMLPQVTRRLNSISGSSNKSWMAWIKPILSLGGSNIQKANILKMSTVSSGTTVEDTNLLFEAVQKFLPISKSEVQFTPTSGGVNNVVQYVDTSDKNRYILRIYNNGNNFERVVFEHAILDELRDVQLSFKIPTTIRSLENKQAYARLSNGAEASLFEIIAGKLPKLSKVYEIGKASGELSAALADVKLDGKLNIKSFPNPPYYELYKVHHAVTKESFTEVMKSELFDHVRKYSDILYNEIIEIEQLANKLNELGLPKQLIHGDLHYDNVLVSDNDVSGILDFEFCAYDWRAMELAVCLSKYAGEPDAKKYFDEFLEGYLQHGYLTETEVNVIPDLINLRILSNVVYFVGRAIAKEDNIDSLTKRAESYSNRVKWIKDNRDYITNSIKSRQAKFKLKEKK
eukprot:gene5885-8115_t